MAKGKLVKTNAVRLLDQQKISYNLIEYDVDDLHVDGVSVAKKLDFQFPMCLKH